MRKDEAKSKVVGVSREAEEAKLKEILEVAQENLERTRRHQESLSGELADMLDSYDTRDKEVLALWHNTESLFQESKRDLLRCIKARKKPYFGRIDFKDAALKDAETYYVGRVGISKDGLNQLVIDWRAPLASVYYENALGPCTYEVKGKEAGETVVHDIELLRKRTYEMEEDTLKDFYDSDVVANDELLTKYLSKGKKAVLGEIIGTIQKEQNAIIRKSPRTNLIVQGVAGSGKTTVAMHRISYILYNYEQFRPVDFYIVGSNRILLNYITSVLPELDVYGVSQMTMEQLFIRLIYEDWDEKKQKVAPLSQKNKDMWEKGEYAWFHALEAFCLAYEKQYIPAESVVIEKNGVVLLEKRSIENYIKNNPQLSVQGKVKALNEWLSSRLENELTGKSVSYTAEEKKELKRSCKIHFGKDEWKGSLYEVYEAFLAQQRAKGSRVFVENGAYDVYDLAALAYLYKRIKEIDGIREASHVIIDEAQDFGMMVYGALAYCLRGCTYTIMGDVSQNIHHGYGLNDWEDLKKLILTGDYDNFGILKKSYRNTVEISNFAMEILRHGNFPVYPAEPILRHGSEVASNGYGSEEKMVAAAVQTIKDWQKNSYETIAVICVDEQEAEYVSELLGKELTLADSHLETAVFDEGVMVLPVEYTKGLEFDAVLLYHPSKEHYPAEDQYVKQLYVAATRALHELSVVHLNDLTELIATPVSEEKRLASLERQKDLERVAKPRVIYKVTEEEKQAELEKMLQRTSRRYGLNQGNEQPKTDVTEMHKTVESQSKTGVAETCKTVESQLKMAQNAEINCSPHPFNSVVAVNALTPKGHSRIDSAVRWVKKTKTYVDFVSSYGVLRVIPESDEIIHIRFMRGQTADFPKEHWTYQPKKNPRWSCRETPALFELATEKLIIRVEKKSGSLQFFDKKGKRLLKESQKEPRQLEAESPMPQTWNYFEWEKNERLEAKAMLGMETEQVGGKARYLSFGGKKMRMPLLLSGLGYGLGIAARHTVFYCGIPMYGQYISTTAETILDYYFLYGETIEETINRYREIQYEG